MGYYLNPALCTSMFVIPTEVVDKHINIASAAHLRVLLWTVRNSTQNIDENTVASALKMSVDAVSDAFLYWSQAGVLLSSEQSSPSTHTRPAEAERPKVLKPRAEKPSRAEIAKLGLSDSKLKFLLGELQNLFGRELRQNELSTFTWLYDYHGMDISVLLMLAEYALSINKATVAFIEKVAIDWLNNGIDNVAAAEKQIVAMHRQKGAWHVVETAMGIEHRQPSEKELALADMWVNEWGYGREILKAAYDTCVDATAKFSIPYIKKILEGWHKNGVKTLEDIKKLSQDDFKKNGKQVGTQNKNYFDLANSMMFSDEDKE